MLDELMLWRNVYYETGVSTEIKLYTLLISKVKIKVKYSQRKFIRKLRWINCCIIRTV